MKPPKLNKYDLKNFETLLKAAKNGDLGLVSAIRKADQKPVALICAMYNDGKDIVSVPFAVMVEGNPYELFEDPTKP